MNVTKPNPRFFCVAWSSGMFTSFTSPKGRNAACSTASFTFSSRPPVYGRHISVTRPQSPQAHAGQHLHRSYLRRASFSGSLEPPLLFFHQSIPAWAQRQLRRVSWRSWRHWKSGGVKPSKKASAATSGCRAYSSRSNPSANATRAGLATPTRRERVQRADLSGRCSIASASSVVATGERRT